MGRAVGIDLGTTYSVVATIENGRPRIVADAEGRHLTPSVVTLPVGGPPLVGEVARRLAANDPERTIFSIKRRMGSDYTFRADGRSYAPEDISALILRKVTADAEARLGGRIDRAVIPVPAYFNDRQRQATREAGLRAGLEVLRLLNEPTAAALAYGLERESASTVLVWDLGGGTFDISILELGEGIFEVRSVSGDTRLGGDDFDRRVMAHLAEEYRRTVGVPYPTEGAATARLREAAEAARIELSSAAVAVAVLSPSGDPAAPPLEVELTRQQLEGLTADLLQRMVLPTRQALRDAALAPADIDRVLLVGGMTRMPAVRHLAREVLGKEPYRYIDPDEVVACGAAIHAGMLPGLVDPAVLLDVLPLSLGVETQGGIVGRIIPRNTPLPASEARVFTTAADLQTSVDIHVLQGERDLAIDNISLGRMRLEGLPPAPRGACRVEVAFDADVDGLVHVTARDLASETAVRVTVVSTKDVDRQEIEWLAGEAGRNAEADRAARERVQAGIAGQNMIAAAELATAQRRRSDQELREIARAGAAPREPLVGGDAGAVASRTRELQELLARGSDRDGLLHCPIPN